METQNTIKKCINCIYYYTTWDRNLPHGCKAYGFKSQKSPIESVKKVSGQDCQLFKPKKGNPSGR